MKTFMSVAFAFLTSSCVLAAEKETPVPIGLNNPQLCAFLISLVRQNPTVEKFTETLENQYGSEVLKMGVPRGLGSLTEEMNRFIYGPDPLSPAWIPDTAVKFGLLPRELTALLIYHTTHYLPGALQKVGAVIKDFIRNKKCPGCKSGGSGDSSCSKCSSINKARREFSQRYLGVEIATAVTYQNTRVNRDRTEIQQNVVGKGRTALIDDDANKVAD